MCLRFLRKVSNISTVLDVFRQIVPHSRHIRPESSSSTWLGPFAIQNTNGFIGINGVCSKQSRNWGDSGIELFKIRMRKLSVDSRIK